MNITRQRNGRDIVVPCSRTECSKHDCPNHSPKKKRDSYWFPSCIKNLVEGEKGYGV